MKPTKRILAENLSALLQREEWSNRELSRKTNGEVSDRYIGMVRNCTTNASVDVLDDLAGPFRLQGWQLILPGLPMDNKESERLIRLLLRYTKASPEGREYIDRVAERESQYQPNRS